MFLFILLSGIWFLPNIASQHDLNFYPNRSGIVHLFEWKFSDIADECENFLGPNGYAGVQTSPVHEPIDIKSFVWWQRYQPVSYMIFSQSGTKDDLSDMIQRCNDSGIRIYIDVVFNHMASVNEGFTGLNGTEFDAINLEFPAVPYNSSDFNEKCIIENYQDAVIIRDCYLLNLPDLNQTKVHVREKIREALDELIDMGVAGFRFDAVKHMWPADVQAIYSSMKNLSELYFPTGSRPFIYQEVIDSGDGVISKFEYNEFGAVTEFQASRELANVFRGRKTLSSLYNWGPVMGMLPHRDALIFVDNHDNQRTDGEHVITYKDKRIYIMATAFLLAHPYGLSRVMSSYDFNGSDDPPPNDEMEIISPTFNDDNTCNNSWICEHRWEPIMNMIKFKNAANGEGFNQWNNNGDNQISFCRGDKAFIAFNSDLIKDFSMDLNVCVPPGVYCDVISGSLIDMEKCSGKYVIVNENRKAFIFIPAAAKGKDGVLAIHVDAKSNQSLALLLPDIVQSNFKFLIN